ncbi:hypothetical protein D9M72_421410 [compost metagenome]
MGNDVQIELERIALADRRLRAHRALRKHVHVVSRDLKLGRDAIRKPGVLSFCICKILLIDFQALEQLGNQHLPLLGLPTGNELLEHSFGKLRLFRHFSSSKLKRCARTDPGHKFPNTVGPDFHGCLVGRASAPDGFVADVVRVMSRLHLLAERDAG